MLERAAVLEAHALGLQVRAVLDEVWLGSSRTAYDDACVRQGRWWSAWSGDLRTVARALEVQRAVGAEAVPALELALVRAARAPDLSTKEQVALDDPPGLDLSGLSARDVRAWWGGLPPETRWQWEALAPTGLGALGGLPVAVRDRINRVSLAQDISRAQVFGADGERRRAAVTSAVKGRAGERPVLLEYDLTAHGGDGTVVLGVGDVERAPRLAVLVTGVGSDAAQARRRVDDLQAIRDASGDATRTAAIWWLDMDAPNGLGDAAAHSTRRAEQGGRELMADLAGVEAVRPSDGRTSLWGHSYGSTTVASGLAEASAEQRTAAGVDAVGLVGSPGAGPARVASDLGVEEVHAVRDTRDPVARLGSDGERDVGVSTRVPVAAVAEPVRRHVGLGVDPTSRGFGAEVLVVQRDWPVSLEGAIDAHTRYFDAGAPSLRRVGEVVSGDSER